MAEATHVRVVSLEKAGVLVTGGTSGVGLETAIQFVQAGVRRIAVIGRNEERGRQACNAISAHAPDAQVEFIAADANEGGQAARAVDQAVKRLGAIDVLVNSTVGPAVPRLFHAMPFDDIGPTVLGQMLAPLLMSHLVLPGMRERNGGVIINIASDAAKVATPGESVIGAAMAAIVMFSRTLAIEAKRQGIRVNVITPSLIEGTATYDRIFADSFSKKLFTGAAALAHLGVAQPEDLAGLIVFLASPAARRITGQAISVNGGISAA
ncbi:SDR family NAD(P)-dependent oxidoreductase [Castellaniella sp.]|uniref:SDR family NAD(P)-dependent oxidoreductase n=1 Tax=Castellaniella sp. TaxID=1955812 RepID=UPI00356AC7A7